MNAETSTSHRSRRPRLLGMGAGLLAVLVAALLGLAGGASAAPGPTDLRLTKSDSPDPVLTNGTLTYVIQVSNLGTGGTADATDVVVTDTLPSQFDFTSASSTSGTCQRTGSTVNCDLGTLNAGASATVTIVGKAKKQGSLSNTASVATSVVDTDPANNQDTESTTVNKASKGKGKGKGKKPKGQSCAAPTIVGTPGNDTLTGTNASDVIRAFAGNDLVFGNGGKDLICADRGADTVNGGDKNDIVIGGRGPDRIFGADGNDLLKGKAGRDRLRGQSGSDFLNGGRGRDSCKGGPDADTLRRCP